MTQLIADPSTVSKRRISIQKTFRPLVRSSRVEVFFRSNSNNIVLGLGKDVFGTNPRSARHISRCERVFVNYFEIWVAQNGGKSFFMEKSYFHLDRPNEDGSGDQELLALHCDPSISVSDPYFKYKRGPHLHISGADPDISKSHISMCLTNMDHVISSVDNLNVALIQIVEMIDDEFLPRFA